MPRSVPSVPKHFSTRVTTAPNRCFLLFVTLPHLMSRLQLSLLHRLEVVWADFVLEGETADLNYNTTDLRNITLKSGAKAMDEAMDACKQHAM